MRASLCSRPATALPLQCGPADSAQPGPDGNKQPSGGCLRGWQPLRAGVLRRRLCRAEQCNLRHGDGRPSKHVHERRRRRLRSDACFLCLLADRVLRRRSGWYRHHRDGSLGQLGEVHLSVRSGACRRHVQRRRSAGRSCSAGALAPMWAQPTRASRSTVTTPRKTPRRHCTQCTRLHCHRQPGYRSWNLNNSAGLTGTVTNNEAWSVMGKYTYDFGRRFQGRGANLEADVLRRLRPYGPVVTQTISRTTITVTPPKADMCWVADGASNPFATDKILQTGMGWCDLRHGGVELHWRLLPRASGCL